jgi:transformation/transcription domain-associated protein
VHELVDALREYAGADPAVAHHLWVLVFPIVWASLAKDQQVGERDTMIYGFADEGLMAYRGTSGCVVR